MFSFIKKMSIFIFRREFCILVVFENWKPSCWQHNTHNAVLLLSSRQSDYLLNLIDRLLFFTPILPWDWVSLSSFVNIWENTRLHWRLIFYQFEYQLELRSGFGVLFSAENYSDKTEKIILTKQMHCKEGYLLFD